MAENEREALLDAIRAAVAEAGEARLTRQQFLQSADFKLSDLHRYFPNWTNALAAAGVQLDPYNQKIPPVDLLSDWGQITRDLGRIPTRNEYKLEGSYSATVFDRNFGSWSRVPQAFRERLGDSPEWADVVGLIPEISQRPVSPHFIDSSVSKSQTIPRVPRRSDRPTYGDPIDFRGLRHEPVNESGVVFLFGMVARELGYLVEAVQGAFPDCEAKLQIAPGKWQRVRIEFEYESRNFREHGHPLDGCDVIVCWKHNWPECPPELEVVELSSILRLLPSTDE
jgi:hypothetical protein